MLDPQKRSDPESWHKPNGVTRGRFIADVKSYYDRWNVVEAKAPGEKGAFKGVKIISDKYGIYKEMGVYKEPSTEIS